MSLIDYVTVSITRTSMPQGHICSIDYSYHLDADKVAYLDHQTFEVTVELCGEDKLIDNELGNHTFDPHRIGSHEAMPITRSFMVPCEMLNEKLGVDAIYIRLLVNASNGETFTARSQTVKDWF